MRSYDAAVLWPFALRFDPAEIAALSSRFGDFPGDEAIEREVVPAARAQGYLTRAQFLRLCEWKSPRPRRLYERNDALAVEKATREALAVPDERRRVEVLVGLSGVGFTVASAILHWVHPDGYPILDYRAVRSAGVDAAAHNVDFWLAYTAFCRDVARRHGVSMRVLDRALWQFDYEVHPPK